MSLGDELIRATVQGLWLGTKVLVKGVGLGVGVARQMSQNKGNYHPRTLSTLAPGEIVPEGVEVFTITLPHKTEWDAERAYHLMEHLCQGGEVCFQITADSNRIQWHVVNWMKQASSHIEKIVTSYYPAAVVEVADYPLGEGNTLYRATLPLQLMVMYPAPILGVDQIDGFDPIASLTEAMGQLQPGERAVITIAMTGFAPQAAEAGHKLITQSNVSIMEYLTIDGAAYAEMRRRAGADQQAKYVAELDRGMRTKLNSRLYHTVLLLQTEAADADRAQELLIAVGSHLDGFTNPPFNGLGTGENEPPQVSYLNTDISRDQYFRTDSLGIVSAWLAGGNDGWKHHLLVLSANELAALWHLPNEELKAARIQRISRVQAPMRGTATSPEDGILIGVNRYGSRETPVYLPNSSRTAHTLITGKTEVGKSSLMHHMIHADIAAGRGLCLIDPHRDLVTGVLRYSIPAHREADVVVLDLQNWIDDRLYLPGINPIAQDPSMDADSAANQILTLFNRLYDDFEDKKMAETFNSALMTLAADPGATLLDLRRLFRDPDYRAQLVECSDDEIISEFWEAYEGMRETQQQAIAEPVLWRLRRFYNNKLLRAITCNPEPLPLQRWIAENRIVLVSLLADERHIPEAERHLLGAALLAQIEMAATAGAITGSYMLYVDETQEFVTTSLSKMLAQVRKRGLAMTLAHQYLKQLAGNTLDAAMGNVANIISFEVGDPDARALAPYMKPVFTADDLSHLGKYRAAISMRYADERLPAFSLETLPPPDHYNGEAREAELRRRSVASWTPKDYKQVLEEIRQRSKGDHDDNDSAGAARGGDDEFFA